MQIPAPRLKPPNHALWRIYIFSHIQCEGSIFLEHPGEIPMHTDIFFPPLSKK